MITTLKIKDFVAPNEPYHLIYSDDEVTVLTGADIPQAEEQEITVTNAQFYLALTNLNMLNGIEAYLNQTGNEDLKVFFDKSPSFSSMHRSVIQACNDLNISFEQKLAVFNLAATLP